MGTGFTSEAATTFVENRRIFGSGRHHLLGFEIESCTSLVESFRAFAEHEQSLLSGLFAESGRYLHPFTDPLTTDMMLPDFLSGEREELYSDMLAWIFKLLDPREVFEVLGLPTIALSGTEALEFHREYVIRGGKRLDLLITQGEKWLIVLELKTKEYDDSTVAKHKFYAEAAGPDCAKLFIARRDTRDNEDGFDFLPWADIGVRLRGGSSRPYQESRVHGVCSISCFRGKHRAKHSRARNWTNQFGARRREPS